LLRIDGDNRAIILRTLAAGIASNVPALSEPNYSIIMDALSKTIDINHKQILNELTSKLPLNEESTRAPPVEVLDEEMQLETETEASERRLRDDLPSDLERDIRNVGYLLLAQRIAAETLTNICSNEDNEMNEDFEEMSDAESVHDYDTNEQQSGTQISADKIPIEISEAVKSLKIVEKVSRNYHLVIL
jgi:hypothetical protein